MRRLRDAIVDCDRSVEKRDSASMNPVLERQERNRQQFYNEAPSAPAKDPRSSEMQQVEENLGESLFPVKTSFLVPCRCAPGLRIRDLAAVPV